MAATWHWCINPDPETGMPATIMHSHVAVSPSAATSTCPMLSASTCTRATVTGGIATKLQLNQCQLVMPQPL
jgi:hypothetical protein